MKNSLQLRAKLIDQIRQFFKARNVLEVETPLLAPSTIPSPHIHSFATQYNYHQQNRQATKTLYLQTSPEFAMKRLLAQGSGDIFQICKAFRNGDEYGKLHNPEFTILEWYRTNFDHHQLMDEMENLLKHVLNCEACERYSYAEIFAKYLQINPHTCSVKELRTYAEQHGLTISWQETDKDNWLQLLLAHFIEPQLGQKYPTFIYDYPPTQAALAKIREKKANPKVAERFEVYIKGIELANGFHELSDATEQRKRFIEELAMRQQMGLELPPLDEKFLQALPDLPDCSGVALGVDRLLMLLANTATIADIMSFDIDTI